LLLLVVVVQQMVYQVVLEQVDLFMLQASHTHLV
jgi:hypothetical protein